MKKGILLLFTISFLFISNKSYSQGFNSIHTPDGVNIIAVGDAGRIFRSSDAGNTWAAYTLSTVNLKCVVSMNNDVWIAGDDGRIYKTLKTVSNISSVEVGISTPINSVFFVDNNLGFLCGNDGVVYKSENGGMNWTSSNSGVSQVKLNSISFVDYQNGIVAGNSGAVYMTNNGGATWTSESIGASKNLLKVKYFNDGIAAAGEYGSLFVKEGSSAWTNINTRIVTDVNGVTGSSISSVRICGGGGFIRNNMNGSSKFYNFETNPMLANLVDIFYYNSDLGFAVSSLNTAVIKTVNGGQSWSLPPGATVSFQWQSKLTSSSGIGNNLCMHPYDRNSMFVAYGSKVFVSRNRGNTWTQIATMTGTGITGGRAHSFYVSPLDTNIWMAAIDAVSPDKIVRSTDYGLTWTIIHSQNFSAYGQPLEMDQNDPNVYYFVPDGGGFWKSTNNGANFTQVSTYSFLSPCDIIVMWDSANVLYVGESSPSRVYRSTDTGVNWEIVLTSTGSEIPSMANSVFDRSIAYATTFSTLLWKTSNYGSNWTNIFTQSGSGWGSDVCHEDPTVYLYGTYSGSTGYITTNGGTSFNTSSISGGGSGAGIIVTERGYMLAQQTSGLLKLNIIYTVLTSSSENVISTNIPDRFELSQNYPNPFNPTTNIKFALPKSGNVLLKMFDRLGKEVAVVTNGFRNAGTYEIIFDASNLSSGVYFYKLITDGASITKKLLLVK